MNTKDLTEFHSLVEQFQSEMSLKDICSQEGVDYRSYISWRKRNASMLPLFASLPPQRSQRKMTCRRLLIISFGLPIGTEITYPVCDRMNALAKAIAEGC